MKRDTSQDRFQKPNPSHPSCPGEGRSHQHYQGKCFTDWNEKDGEWRRVWPEKGVYAVVFRDSVRSWKWAWIVKMQRGEVDLGPTSMGHQSSAAAAKATATRFVEGMKRKNPPGDVFVRIESNDGSTKVHRFSGDIWRRSKMNTRDRMVSNAVGGKSWTRWDEITDKSNPSPSIVSIIRPGDRVVVVDRFGKEHTGKAVMVFDTHAVLNMGGAHGTPQVANESNIVKVWKGKGAGYDFRTKR